MRMRSLLSASLVALAAAIALPLGCAVEEPDPGSDPSALVSRPDELSQAPQAADPNGGEASGPSCDDFDSYCNAQRPCGEGFECRLDTGHCGRNFFGTYPDCGVTATCYPACQPK